MWKNHLTVALRHLRRRKGYAALNVAGLATGLACCALIGLYVREELAYDDWHRDAARVHRIESDWGDFTLPTTNWPLIEAFRTDFPQVEVAHLVQFGGTVRRGEQHFNEDHLLFANPAFFDVLSFRLARGEEATALAAPYGVVLSPRTARKYFGAEDPMGQTLRLYDQYDVTVTGVLAEPPGPSHIKPDVVVSWPSLDAAFDYTANQEWGSNNQYTYLKLPEGMDPAAVEAAFPALIERHAGDDWNGATLGLQRLTDIHLTSHHDMELEPNGKTAYVVLFGAVALFILLLACVNFMNLATARSLERAREVGVRKAVGAQRGQLARQFLAEAVLLAGMGLVLALALVALALPYFRTLADRPLALTAGVVGPALAVAALLALGVGLLSGSYPALVLSGFRPAEVLRGRFAASGRGARLRQGLVVFQFAIAVVLIVGTLGVHTQLRYLREADLHFDAPQVVSLPIPQDSVGGAPFLDALRGRPEVLAAAMSSESLPSELLDGNGTTLAGVGDPETLFEQELFVPTRMVSAGPRFFEVLGAEMALGREFSEEFASDSSAFVLNETAARMLQAKFPEHLPSLEAMVGRELQMGGQQGPLVGIVRDFNMSSLHEVIEPIVFYISPSNYSTFLVRAAPGSATATVGALRAAYAQVYPEALFDYQFADAGFDAAYRDEERLGQLFSVFAGLAVFIACLGLFGLAAYAAERRTKEIGVRKVLGASAGHIVGLLSKDFAKLVAVGIVVAVPAAWWGMDLWLDRFAYRTGLGAGLFVAAGALALLIALGTVASQALRAASSDPIKALRYE
jgi:putative ABC transport system permease protein